jgi:hypothetical protein
LDANEDNAICYVEQHFNSAGPTANYSCVIVGSNASERSKNWGTLYSRLVSEAFQVPDRGIVIGGFNGRGDANLRHTAMPAILLEPLFASNPEHAHIIRSSVGQETLAQILVTSIRRIFPDGGLVAMSIGHKGKTSRPNDRGAAVVGGGFEADYAEIVLKLAEQMLLAAPNKIAGGREISVRLNGNIVWKTTVDEDAEIVWSPQANILYIKD